MVNGNVKEIFCNDVVAEFCLFEVRSFGHKSLEVRLEVVKRPLTPSSILPITFGLLDLLISGKTPQTAMAAYS